MRIAIPVAENKGVDSTVAEHFGHVQFLAIYDSETMETEFAEVDQTVSGCSPVAAISDRNIDAIYALGMGMRAVQECSALGIKLKTGNFHTVKEIIENLDRLQDLEGNCGH